MRQETGHTLFAPSLGTCLVISSGKVGIRYSSVSLEHIPTTTIFAAYLKIQTIAKQYMEYGRGRGRRRPTSDVTPMLKIRNVTMPGRRYLSIGPWYLWIRRKLCGSCFCLF